MWASYLLAFAFAISPMTATRGESAIGPVDIILVISAMYSFVESFALAGTRREQVANNTKNLEISPGQNSVFIFWGLAIISLTISMLLNFKNSIYDISKITTIYGPYLVNFMMVAALANEIWKGRIESLVKAFVVVSVLIGLLYIFGIAIGLDSFYYFGVRFSGLSLNPNQTGLHALAIIIVSLLYLNKFRNDAKSIRYLAYFSMLLAFAFGIASRSDTFVVCVALVGAGQMVKLGLHYMKTSISKFSLILFSMLGVVFLIYLFNVKTLNGMVTDTIQQIQYADQDVVRFLLWRNGIEAWKENIIFGNGPGAWSGVAGPFLLKEAHNTFIDWLSITGVVGTILYFWLLFQIFRLNVERHLLSYTALVALIAFSSFHYVFRVPVFWFAMLLVMIPEVKLIVGQVKPKNLD